MGRREVPDRIRPAAFPGRRAGAGPEKDRFPLELAWIPMSKRTVKRKLRAKKKANHGKKPNCGRG